jgi:hypothetical protein
MIRPALAFLALLLAGIAGLHLYRDVEYLRAADRTIPALLAGDGAVPPAGLLIVLQPEDCLRSGDLVARWNALYRAGRFPITAVMVGKGSHHQLLRRQNLELPLRAITARDAGIIAEKLGHPSTPFAVMIDRAGRVAGSFPASQNVPLEVVEQAIAGSGTHRAGVPGGPHPARHLATLSRKRERV